MRKEPDLISSYSSSDVMFVLRDLNKTVIETPLEERESLVQSGKRHYSEMLPIEYQPDEEYVNLYNELLYKNAKSVALNVAIVSEKIVQSNGIDNLVIVSLARAGTPVGILVKRYIEKAYKIKIPHYSISIIRDKGIDENALAYIFKNHPKANLQFVDGWTGKGAILIQLEKSVVEWNAKNEMKLSSKLAVVADPGHCASYFGTQEDVLIPSACLNSTVSGLVSRTVLNEDLIVNNDFHGAKYYEDLEEFDLSNDFIDRIDLDFSEEVIKNAQNETSNSPCESELTWTGLASVEKIKTIYQIKNINHIKPGIGETTRVLLRRIPWKVLVNPNAENDLSHILLLAKQRGVVVEYFDGMPYSCCGLIKEL